MAQCQALKQLLQCCSHIDFAATIVCLFIKIDVETADAYPFDVQHTSSFSASSAQCLRETPAHIMNNMSALDEALDILPFRISRW